LYAVAFVDGWHFWGFLVVIYITGMYQVDNSLYEAADIEGATKFQKFRFVTFPLIRPVFIFSLVIIIIWSIPTFDYIWILTQGGPAYSSEVVATNLYSQAFDRFNVGYSSAIGTLMCIYTIFIVSIFAILRKLGWEI
jgi:raffinose/stachyose/melibiose transport system permease protein